MEDTAYGYFTSFRIIGQLITQGPYSLYISPQRYIDKGRRYETQEEQEVRKTYEYIDIPTGISLYIARTHRLKY